MAIKAVQNTINAPRVVLVCYYQIFPIFGLQQHNVYIIVKICGKLWVGINSGPGDQGPGTRDPGIQLFLEVYTLYNLY